MACTPTSGKTLVVVEAVPPLQLGSVGRWQVSQVVGKPAAAWFGLLRAVVVGTVAADAVARRALVDVVLVAGRARLGRVPADEREELGVIEAAAVRQPGRVGR